MKDIRLFTLAVCATVRVFAAYQYDFPSLLNPYAASQWTANGVYSASNNLFTSSDSAGGSLIFNGTVSGDSTTYEVRMTLTLTTSGGYYLTMLRSTSNGLVTNGNTGTWYAIEIANPTFSGGACSATLYVLKGVGGTISWPYSTTVPCHNGMVVRSVMSPGLIMVYLDNGWGGGVWDSSITTGQPGIDVAQAPAGNGISAVDIGHRDAVPPNAVNAQLIGTSSFSNRVDLQWPGVVDDTNGSGFRQYYIYRDGSWLAGLLNPTFSDTTVTPGAHTYTISALDYHFNAANTTINVNVPAAGAIDPRQIGVRPLGTYWGYGGEQIDMRSGNLNYSVPLLKAVGRGGWGVNFNLTYNSQNWRQDSGGTWQFGRDVGYGYGWKLLAGSLIPVYSTTWVLHHYIFTDSTGAEYRLDQNNSGAWSSKESIYIYYDSNVGRLYFRDGSFWVFGCTSAGSEQDAGAMYPTTMEDANGNQITIDYNNGADITWSNSSSRINTIRDVRPSYYPTYTFAYDQTTHHLTSVTNGISTSEAYSFSYGSSTLYSPFDHTSFGMFSFLQSQTASGISLTTTFSYDNNGTGELMQLTTPYAGHIKWSYGSTTYVSNRTQREVQNRYLSKAYNAPETTYAILHDNPTNLSIHSWTLLNDPGGLGQKYWYFQTDTSQASVGLVTTHGSNVAQGVGTGAHLENYTWSADAVGNSCISATITTEDSSNPTSVQKKVTQTLDQYGNLTQIQVFDYGAAGGPPQTTAARTYTNTYLSNSNYTSRYIFNRLATSTVTDGVGRTATLASMLYDGGVSDQPNMPMHDAAYGTSFSYRGNPYSVQRPGSTTSISYDIGGNVVSSTTNGVPTTATSTSANNYAVPSQLTNSSAGMTTLNTNLSWTNFFGISAQTGPNGDSASISYDSNARPNTTYSPYGASTTYNYQDSGSPPMITVSTNGHGVRTTKDGFGRTIKTESGTTTGTPPTMATVLSVVDTVYDSCGCSPIGKLKQVSQPHLPGATPVYTSYNYDGMGRTASVISPDGASTTTYVYAGNTVTVTDPAGKWKKFYMDALGNLTRVDELDSALGTVSTSYSYDVLNHLTLVTMTRGSTTQNRTFNYTTGTTVGALLLSATNPENGTVNYTYNAGNNLVATKTDANGTQLVYAYDGYNRLTQVSIGGQYPSVLRTYYYDSNPFDSTYSQYAAGRLAAVRYGNPAGSTHPYIEMYSYTQAGLPAGKRFRLTRDVGYGSGLCLSQTLTADLNASYTYNNEGKLASTAYPNGSTYTYSFDSMGRPGGLTDQSNAQVVYSVVYGPANELLGLTMQGIGAESRQYNSRLQLTNISMNGYPGMNLQYTYSSNQNNGKIISQKDFVSLEEVAYSYDSLNRLISAVTTAASDQVTTPWGQGFNYDGFGNLTAKTALKGSVPTLSVGVDPATNRLVANSYDNNGNMTTTSGGPMYYDAENRLITAQINGVATLTYDYDPNSKRIVKNPGQANELFYFYGADGKNLGTYTATASSCGTPNNYIPPSLTFSATSSPLVYFGNRLLAKQDRLGSVGSYYPYGDDKNVNNPADSPNFATYWKDSITNLDYADQRYYSNQFARFMSPDPGPANLKNPQSFNRYTYAANDPVNLNDPNGRLPVCVDVLSGGSDGSAANVCMTGQILVDIEPGMFFGPVTATNARDRAIDILESLVGGVIDDFSFVNSTGSLANISVSGDFFQAGIDAGIIVGNPAAWTIGGVIIRGVAVLAGGEVVLTVAATAYIGYELYQIYQKSDIKQNKDAANQVSRELGCRKPTADDYDTVHEIIKNQKGPDGKVSYDVLLDAWRSVLCKK